MYAYNCCDCYKYNNTSLCGLGIWRCLYPGFVHYLRQKTQGPYFEMSRTSSLFTSKNINNENSLNVAHFSIMYMPENNAKALATILDLTYCNVCMTAWRAFQTMKTSVNNNSRTFMDQEWIAEIFKDFQGLECTLKIQGFSRRIRTLFTTQNRNKLW